MYFSDKNLVKWAHLLLALLFAMHVSPGLSNMDSLLHVAATKRTSQSEEIKSLVCFLMIFFYFSVPEEITVSPPNCLATLINWRTLALLGREVKINLKRVLTRH